MKLYKLTKRNTTRRGMRWGPGVTNTVTPRPNPLLEARLPQLCTSDVIHAYVHPLQALLHRDHHGYGGVSVKCWEAEGHVVAYDATKVGVKSLTTIRVNPLATPEPALGPSRLSRLLWPSSRPLESRLPMPRGKPSGLVLTGSGTPPPSWWRGRP